jgi:hypothetical protein
LKEKLIMDNDNETKGKGPTSDKIQKLQKQYNKILVDLFSSHAAECVEEALDQSEGGIGENISGIVQNAAESLKSKVLEELGISSPCGGAVVAVGGFDAEDDMGDTGPVDIEIAGVGEMDDEDVEDEDVTEEGKMPEGLAKYMKKKHGDSKDGDEDDEDDEDVKEEGKMPPGLAAYMKKKHGDKKDEKECTCDGPCTCDDHEHDDDDKKEKMDEAHISRSRRGDQTLLSEVYSSIYKK